MAVVQDIEERKQAEKALQKLTRAVEQTAVDLTGDLTGPVEIFDLGDHRYCTECVLEGDELDREAIMQRLETLD